MAYENCIPHVEAAMGRKVTDSERREIGKMVEDVFRREGALNGEDTAVRVTAKLRQAIGEAKAAAIIKKKNAALNQKAFIEKYGRMVDVWHDSPEDGLEALTTGSNVDRVGARNSAEAHQEALKGSYLTGLGHRLVKGKLKEVAFSGEFDEHAFKAMAELSKEKPDPAVLKNLDPTAVKLAQVFHDVTEVARVDANNAGAWIKKLEGYVIRRSHDGARIKEAGQEKWTNFMLQNVDWDKTAPTVFSDQAKRKILQTAYSELSTGVNVRFDGAESTKGFDGTNNLAKKLSHSRYFHFKDVNAEWQYHKAFGRQAPLVESVGQGLRNMARDTALMRHFGPHAEANFGRIVEKWKDKYSREGNTELLERLDKRAKYIKRTVWPALTGADAIPENAAFAARSKMLRNLESMADLGKAVVSSIPDLAMYASTMRYGLNRNMGDFLKGMGEAVGNIFQSASSPDRIKLASEMGILIDALHPGASDVAGDALSKTDVALRRFFEMNGLTHWQDRMRVGAVTATAHRHAQHAGLKFSELPEGMQAFFRQFDVSPAEWDLIRSGEISKDSKGHGFLTPESVAEIDPEKFDVLPEVIARRADLEKTHELLVRKAKEANAKDAEYLGKRLTKLKEDRAKDKARMEEYQLDKLADVAHLRSLSEETQAYMDLADLEAELAYNYKNEVQDERLRGYLERVEDGSHADRVGDMATRSSRRYGTSQEQAGQRLGGDLQRARRRVKDLEKKIKAGEAAIDDRTKAHAERMTALRDKFKEYADRTRERTDARAARVKEFHDSIGKHIDAAREKARENLIQKYRAMYHEVGAMATSAPGKTERAMLLQGTQPGTWSGEAARHFSMYKSFTLAVLRRHIGRELHGYTAEARTNAQAILDAIKHPTGSSFGGLANLMVFGAMTGAASMTIHDLAKGRKPRVPDSPENAGKYLASAMTQAGVFGIYGDFLWGNLRSRFGHSPIETLLGPTARRVVDLIDLSNRLRGTLSPTETKDQDLAASSLRFAYNNTPQLFYSKWAMDYLFLYRFMEWANPGSLERMEEKIRRENGQEFLVPPSSLYGR